MNGNGVPLVLDANGNKWLDRDAGLYHVMEFIEGPTMSEVVHKAPPSLDQALACTMRILEILAVGQALPLQHRDLNPTMS